MENERLVFLSTTSHGDGVRLQIEKTLEQRSRTFDAVLKQTPTIQDALSILSDGLGDVVAMSPLDWEQNKSSEFTHQKYLISTIYTSREHYARSIRRPDWVAIAEAIKS